ncbi:hypothetical protein A2318_01655 [Candidatus Uhrbacteria bacterium RIFOXYB2_FULL_45_11]|uniref:Uncharacterized protein n=1 Tax=Candidatus Uhrbacteria bacterium RIFOXYB2_FULL_45_11 TaxID=1802421 RepID=A0A1F7W4A3_9BACT|nr:MAG: hypothetical protein A2318_01655 [Candidatus Uhrbacteria bacterium RIFOXYB2_FULL_45_11]
MVETDEEEAFLANRRPRREKQPSNATQSPGDSIQFSYFEWDWKENAPVDEIFKAVERLSKDGKLATVFDVHFDGDAYAKVVMAHGGTQQMAQHILDQFFRFEHGTFYPADMMGYDNDEPRKVRGVRA